MVFATVNIALSLFEYVFIGFRKAALMNPEGPFFIFVFVPINQDGLIRL